MRAVWLEVPEDFLEERRRLGLDKKDELWDGVLHMVPPPAFRHTHFAFELARALATIAERRGWNAAGDCMGLFDSDANYRVPDAVIWRPGQESERGLESAIVVVEVLSPSDESREKQPFYAAVGVAESWIVDPITRAVEVYVLEAGRYVPVPPSRSPVLGITIELVGARLRLSDGDSVHEV